MKFITLLALAALTATVTVQAHNKVIYGEDNRKDLYNVKSSELIEIARSTVALIPSRKMQSLTNGLASYGTTTFGDSRPLCSTERFRDQLNAPICSGFLVGENLVVTAGHCIETQKECKDLVFVFDYAMENAENLKRQSLKNAYRCKEMIGRKKIDTGADWALVELERNVTDREPLKIRQSGELQPGDELYVVGHPSGLPTKLTDGAYVRSRDQDNGFFVANLDTYGGNSGSAVFNAKTNEIEGILVRGEQDFEYKNGCMVSKKCGDEDCRGEDVTYISEVCQLNGKECVVEQEPALNWNPNPSTGNNFCSYAHNGVCNYPIFANHGNTEVCAFGTDYADCGF